MERRKIMPALLGVLIAAAAFLALFFWITYRNIHYLPEEALDDLCVLLEKDNVALDRDLVSLKRETGTIYACDSTDYSRSVAERLGGSGVKYRFATPEGEIMLLYNGAVLEFSSDFAFRYRVAESESEKALPEPGEEDGWRLLEDGAASETERAVTEFLEDGSDDFHDRNKLNIVTVLRAVYEKDGVYYAECVRTIDGLEITENRVVCIVQDGRVTRAEGKWCFLTQGESYSSQLTDVLNILFNVKKEISNLRGDGAKERVSVEGVHRCYTLYYLGDDGFCFIPCWQIVTDLYGEFIYNAVDGTLYTRK